MSSLEMFQPQLDLKCSRKDGHLVLHAETPTPTSCYSAGEARLRRPGELPIPVPRARAPSLVRSLLPDPRQVPWLIALELEHTSEICLPRINVVEHRLEVPWNQVGGRTGAVAVVLLDGRILGQSYVVLDPPDTCPIEDHPIGTGNWQCWRDLQPPVQPNLHLRGEVTVPEPCWEAHLCDPRPEGNELRLRLDVQREPPNVPCPQVITTLEVKWHSTEEWTRGIETVIIENEDGEGIGRCRVKEVH